METNLLIDTVNVTQELAGALNAGEADSESVERALTALEDQLQAAWRVALRPDVPNSAKFVATSAFVAFAGARAVLRAMARGDQAEADRMQGHLTTIGTHLSDVQTHAAAGHDGEAVKAYRAAENELVALLRAA